MIYLYTAYFFIGLCFVAYSVAEEYIEEGKIYSETGFFLFMLFLWPVLIPVGIFFISRYVFNRVLKDTFLTKDLSETFDDILHISLKRIVIIKFGKENFKELKQTLLEERVTVQGTERLKQRDAELKKLCNDKSVDSVLILDYAIGELLKEGLMIKNKDGMAMTATPVQIAKNRIKVAA